MPVSHKVGLVTSLAHLSLLYILAKRASFSPETEITVFTIKFDLRLAPHSARLCGQYSPGAQVMPVCVNVNQWKKLLFSDVLWKQIHDIGLNQIHDV